MMQTIKYIQLYIGTMDIHAKIRRVKEELDKMVDMVGDNMGFIDFLHKIALGSIFYGEDDKELDFSLDMFEDFRRMYGDQKLDNRCTVIVRNELGGDSRMINESTLVSVENDVDAFFRTKVSDDGRIYCSPYKGRDAKVIIFKYEES